VRSRETPVDAVVIPAHSDYFPTGTMVRLSPCSTVIWFFMLIPPNLGESIPVANLTTDSLR